MLQLLGPIDWLVFGALVLLLIAGGVWAGRKKKNAEEYFMAGRSLRWWSVAGSIYGANVSLSQIIGMLGIGYSIGFAQSHYEILAIPAILLLCYIFIPVYRRRGVFTLSAYLAHRYGATARLIYSLSIIGIILILLVGGLYIGSRQLGLLFNTAQFHFSYLQGIVLIAIISCCLIVWGGMSSLVITENIISLLMVSSLILVGWFTLSREEIGGLTGLLQLDKGVAGQNKMTLYLPSHHPDLPWTGVFSGLLVLQGFFWTTNQFEVQRVLSARTNRDAQLGALLAGMLKLTIPFFSIAAGVAAAYLFKHTWHLEGVKPDDAFLILMSKVVPAGSGLYGWILAGLTAAIFSSIYSMLNAASTLITVDVYQQYVHKAASDQQMVRAGRWSVVVLTALAALLAFFTFTPTSSGNFFLELSRNTSYLKPGIVAIFFWGVISRKIHPASAVPVLILSPILSVGVELVYAVASNSFPSLQATFGAQLNFMHRVMLVFIGCVVLQWLISKRLNVLKGEPPAVNTIDVLTLKNDWWKPLAWFVLIQVIGCLSIQWGMKAAWVAWPTSVGTFLLFIPSLLHHEEMPAGESENTTGKSIHLFAGLLSAVTIWILYYFY
jgi:SSS family solute:Na+ symporter